MVASVCNKAGKKLIFGLQMNSGVSWETFSRGGSPAKAGSTGASSTEFCAAFFRQWPHCEYIARHRGEKSRRHAACERVSPPSVAVGAYNHEVWSEPLDLGFGRLDWVPVINDRRQRKVRAWKLSFHAPRDGLDHLLELRFMPGCDGFWRENPRLRRVAEHAGADIEHVKVPMRKEADRELERMA